LDILFEDDYFLIVNKPAGIAVHPSILHYSDSLSNGVKYYFEKIGLQKKIRPINRLDKDTSGIVIFAKNEYIQECLVRQMASNVFKKKYIAILLGILEKDSGTINAPISRKDNSIIERCIDENGEKAISHFKVIKRLNKLTQVEYTLETGRTHQLRVHSMFIGHPILGDSLYGKKSDLISRQALHAYEVSFVHPITKKEMVIFSGLPFDMQKILSV
jgi:23S rRNA pseudouridine1911/1915/1917 synthase